MIFLCELRARDRFPTRRSSSTKWRGDLVGEAGTYDHYMATIQQHNIRYEQTVSSLCLIGQPIAPHLEAGKKTFDPRLTYLHHHLRSRYPRKEIIKVLILT